MPRPTRLLRIALAAALAVFLAGFASDALAQKKGGVLKIGNLGEPPSLDPHWGTQTITEVLANHIYEGLYSLDAGYRPIPMLAEGMPHGLARTGSPTPSSSARASSSTTARR